MQYEVGDVVKLDLDVQTIVERFALVCPYVEVMQAYNSDRHATLRAYGDFYNIESGRLYSGNVYSFNPTGSTLAGQAQEAPTSEAQPL
jgi:hypothetical protein